MKFLFAGAMVAFALFAAPQVSHAAVYAGHLSMTANGDGTFELSYRLNEDANQGVTINIMGPAPANTVVRTITFPNQSKGLQTVQWDGLNNSATAVPNGTYTWEVVASTNNPSTEEYLKVDLGTPSQLLFDFPYSLAVDKNVTSPHFGTVYVGNRKSPTATYTLPRPGVETGIYVLSNDLEDFTNQGDTSYKGGAANPQYPWEIFVAPTSEVFIAEYVDAVSNVFVMDPDNMEGEFSMLFDGTGRNAVGLNSTNGSIYGLYIEGTGEDMTLYTLDEDLPNFGSVWSYNIGETRSNFSATPTVVYDDGANGNYIQNYTGEVHKDTHPDRSGWFISQTRDAETAALPTHLHYDGTTVDWRSSVDFTFWLNQNYNASFDLNQDSTRMVSAGFGWLLYLDIDVADLKTMNDDSVLYEDTAAGPGLVSRDVRFDAAENILLVSSGANANLDAKRLFYYSKQGENTFTTPNPTGAEIVIGSSTVHGWELY